MKVAIDDYTHFIATNGRGIPAKCFILLAVFSDHKTSPPAIKANFHQTNFSTLNPIEEDYDKK